MCCRYWMEESPELRPFVERMNQSPLADKMRDRLARPLTAAGEVRPTDIVPVVAPDRHFSPAVYPMLWGFANPRSGQPLVNCRVETASEKTLWQEAWRKHRCVIPISWYYEWEHLPDPQTGKVKTGQKYMIHPKGCTVSCLAGLYRIEEKNGLHYPVFTVLTREASDQVRFIHDRMPVILDRDMVRNWLNPENKPEDMVKQALSEMVFEKAG